MALGQFTFVNQTIPGLGNGLFDLDTDTFNAALVSSASNISATSTTFGGVTGELPTANGYTAGGVNLTTPTYTSAQFKTGNASWTTGATGFSARWLVIYKVGTANAIVNPVLGYFLLDSTNVDFVFAANKTEQFANSATGWFNAA